MNSSQLTFIDACNEIGRQVAVVYTHTGEDWFVLSSYTPHDDGSKEFKGKLANQFIDSGAFTACRIGLLLDRFDAGFSSLLSACLLCV